MTTTAIFDRLPLTGLRRDSAGNVIGVARAARTGIQIYAGYEVGRPEMRQVRVWRPEAEVFHRDSMASFASCPVTIEHPSEFVTPTNWKDHAAGETESDNIVRDGETVKVPFIIRDAAGIAAIEDGKHEVSMGYGSTLDFTAGTVPDGQADAGEAYDCVQRNIRINHLAIVDKARGGPTLRIGDNQPKEANVKTMIVDGLSVEVTDAAETALNKVMGERDKARTDLADAQTQIGTLTADKAKLEGEKVALETAVKDATSPDKLHAAATARANLIADAKRIIPTLDCAKLDDAAIKRAVVDAKLGDAGKALADGAAVDGAFAVLAAGAPKGQGGSQTQTNDSLTSVVLNDDGGDDGQTVTQLADAREKAKADRNARYGNYGADAKSA